MECEMPRRKRKRPPWLWRVFQVWRDRGTDYVVERALRRIRGARQDYPRWHRKHVAVRATDRVLIKQRIARLPHTPHISVVLVAGDALTTAGDLCISSVLEQIYPHWELVVLASNVQPGGPRFPSDVRIRLESFKKMSSLLAATTGEFVIVLDQPLKLEPHALYLIAEEINAHPPVNLIYTDEDKVDENGVLYDPHFKTDWNPDLFLSQNYLAGLLAYRRELSADAPWEPNIAPQVRSYERTLRAIEMIAPETIRHIPLPLCHWPVARDAQGGDGPKEAAQPGMLRVLQEHLDRRGLRATAEPSRSGRFHRVRRRVPDEHPLVSLVIPTRDNGAILKGAIESIRHKTEYAKLEIIIVDNASATPETLEYLAQVARDPIVRVLRYEKPFNYSAINNFAAQHCRGSILGLLNDDVVVINADWLTELVSHAVRPEVGAVGAMLYYPDQTIQHAGIAVGFGQSALNLYNGRPRSSCGYHSRAELVQNYSAVTGACLLTRADVFAQVRGLDESNLAVAFNDVDYCLRVREEGYLVTWTPYAELYHLESISRGDDWAADKIKRFTRERRYFAQRWMDVLPRDPYYNVNLSLDEPFELAYQPRRRPPRLIH